MGLGIVSIVKKSTKNVPVLTTFTVSVDFFKVVAELVHAGVVRILGRSCVHTDETGKLSSMGMVLHRNLGGVLVPILAHLMSVIVNFFYNSTIVRDVFSVRKVKGLTLGSIVSGSAPILRYFVFVLTINVMMLGFLISVTCSTVSQQVRLGWEESREVKDEEGRGARGDVVRGLC